MAKTLNQKITSNDVIGLLKTLSNKEIVNGIDYADSGFRGKHKDGFYAEQQSTQDVIDYIQKNYPVSMGKHKVKHINYNKKKDINKHKIKLLNKYKTSLKIEFED